MCVRPHFQGTLRICIAVSGMVLVGDLRRYLICIANPQYNLLDPAGQNVMMALLTLMITIYILMMMMMIIILSSKGDALLRDDVWCTAICTRFGDGLLQDSMCICMEWSCLCYGYIQLYS